MLGGGLGWAPVGAHGHSPVIEQRAFSAALCDRSMRRRRPIARRRRVRCTSPGGVPTSWREQHTETRPDASMSAVIRLPTHLARRATPSSRPRISLPAPCTDNVTPHPVLGAVAWRLRFSLDLPCDDSSPKPNRGPWLGVFVQIPSPGSSSTLFLLVLMDKGQLWTWKSSDCYRETSGPPRRLP